MSIFNKMKSAAGLIADKDRRTVVLSGLGWKLAISDEEFLKRKYRFHMKQELELDAPKTYTQKLQWLKLYDHRPEYTAMVDKLEAKNFAAQRIGAEYVIPTLGVWERPEDVDFDTLPEQFVVKCTHDSGGLVICKDKAGLDQAAARRKLAACLKRDYYNVHREWPYKDVPKRILAEPYMEDLGDGELRDYKFFTFGGVPKVLYIAQGRGKGEPTVADFFDMEGNHLPFTIDHDMAAQPPHLPENFKQMQQLAAKLSQGTPQLRVDFYEVNGRVYFGEMTFFHCSGFAAFHPESWDRTFGDWVTLPNENGRI